MGSSTSQVASNLFHASDYILESEQLRVTCELLRRNENSTLLLCEWYRIDDVAERRSSISQAVLNLDMYVRDFRPDPIRSVEMTP